MNAYSRLCNAIVELSRAATAELTAAAKDGRFDDLAQLTPMAKEIAGMVARWCAEPQFSGTEHRRSTNDHSTPADVLHGSSPMETDRLLSSQLKRADYPHFVRERDELIKLGWSPRENGPYEHRVPKKCVDAVASAIMNKGKNGRRFSIDEILSSTQNVKGQPQFPTYQVYAVVAWLKWVGMVLQHGRQGYTMIRPQTFDSSLSAAWQALPQR